MSIDPINAYGHSPVGRSAMTTGSVSRQQGQSFEKLLKAAEATFLSAQELAREATEMVKMARLQMLQGLFDFEDSSADNSLLAQLETSGHQFELPQAESQMFDNLYANLPDLQASLLKPAPTSRGEIEQMIDRVAKHVSLAPELIRSVVNAESDFTPDAVSPAGAQGLMQLMPETAQELGVKDSFNPLENLLGGSRYLKQLLDKYDGDLDQALAAYNWGQGNVDRKGLANMPQETRDYVLKVKGQWAG